MFYIENKRLEFFHFYRVTNFFFFFCRVPNLLLILVLDHLLGSLFLSDFKSRLRDVRGLDVSGISEMGGRPRQLLC